MKSKPPATAHVGRATNRSLSPGQRKSACDSGARKLSVQIILMIIFYQWYTVGKILHFYYNPLCWFRFDDIAWFFIPFSSLLKLVWYEKLKCLIMYELMQQIVTKVKNLYKYFIILVAQRRHMGQMPPCPPDFSSARLHGLFSRTIIWQEQCIFRRQFQLLQSAGISVISFGYSILHCDPAE